MINDNNYCYFCNKLLNVIYMYNDLKLCCKCKDEFIIICDKYCKNYLYYNNENYKRIRDDFKKKKLENKIDK